MAPPSATVCTALVSLLSSIILILRLRRRRFSRISRLRSERKRRLLNILAAYEAEKREHQTNESIIVPEAVPSTSEAGPSVSAPLHQTMSLTTLGKFSAVEHHKKKKKRRRLNEHGEPIKSKKQRIWSYPTDDSYWQYIMSPNFTKAEWLENFRMSKETFMFICDQLRDHIQSQDTIFRSAVPVEKKVAILLWRLITNLHYGIIAKKFGVGRSTVFAAVRDAAVAINMHLTPQFITFPTPDDCRENMQFFDNVYGMPSCLGAIGLTHVALMTPADCKDEYTLSNGSQGLLMQMVVGKDGNIMDLLCQYPGSTAPTTVLEASAFYQKGEAESFVPSDFVQTQNIAPYLVGSSIYPLRKWLLVPYRQEALISKTQKMYNKALAGVQSYFDQTLVKLRGRWRSLTKRYDTFVRFVPEIVTACVTLHNICESRGEEFHPWWVEDYDDLFSDFGCSPDKDDPAAEGQRDAVATLLTFRE